MYLLLILTAVSCLWLGYQWQKNAQGFMGDYIIAHFIAPFITFLILLLEYYVLYGVNPLMFLTIIPLLIPAFEITKQRLMTKRNEIIYYRYSPILKKQTLQYLQKCGMDVMTTEIAITTMAYESKPQSVFSPITDSNVSVDITLTPLNLQCHQFLNENKDHILSNAHKDLYSSYSVGFLTIKDTNSFPNTYRSAH